MLSALLSATAASHSGVLALQNFGRSQAAYGVIVGLAILAVIEIAAGLFMVRAGTHHRSRH